ncbi:hypothetical protein VP01_6861g1, partial [Puccinia sorghi]
MAQPAPLADQALIGAGDSFRKAMLKTALETIPQLTEENYSIWRDKITAHLKLRGVLNTINDTLKLWRSIKERFASSQSSNRARIFNEFLYVKFQEDAVETFVTDTKVAIKKLVDVGIDLPQDILAYLVLFKFPNSLQTLKHPIMHSDKELDVHQQKTNSGTTEAALSSQKGKGNKSQGNDQSNNQTNGSKRCKLGYHNPKQDANYSSKNCWHLHPDKAPDWWKELQAQWKASKEKENYFMSLVKLWIELDPQFFNHLEIGNFDSIKTGKRDATLHIKGKGSVKLMWGGKTIQLENCLFVPDIISARELSLKGCEIVAKNSTFSVSKENH